MQKKTSNLFLLAKHLSFLLFLYSVCRIIFYAFNYSYFSDLSFTSLLPILFYGIRFDVSVIVLINFLFIALYLLPFDFVNNKAYRILLKGLFVSTNGIALFANCVDFTFFSFTVKRTNASIFNFFGGNIGNDLVQLLPTFIIDYWYIFLLGGIFIYLLLRQYNKTEGEKEGENAEATFAFKSIQLLLCIAISIVLYRGGFQLKPISMVTAGKYTSVKYISLVLNTPFTLLKTLDLKAIEISEVWKIDDMDRLQKTYSPLHNIEKKKSKKRFKKPNIVIIALESFSKEYVGALNNRDKGFTPFLDSLIAEGLICTDAYSNGKTSIDGIPSIFAGVPTWMNEPFITSPYGTNRISSLANLLKPFGYYSAFFHGGTNGTMGFDGFSKIAGYNNYYGRTEFNNEEYFDGNWGIWDEEFLQYTCKEISTKPQPFFASIFTLSSHHPYLIPEKYEGKFPKGKLPIEECIAYADYSLRKFFEAAKKTPWFKNTLFVLCPDHTSISKDPFYTNKVGNYSIPILYYYPKGRLKGEFSDVTQQIDIIPTILDYINYPNNYFSFGTSIFDRRAQHFALTYNSNTFQLMENNHVLLFDGDYVKGLYNYKNDSLLKNDLSTEEINRLDSMEFKTKAIIQTYQQSLMRNKMRILKN